jgi:hypothetical protein
MSDEQIVPQPMLDVQARLAFAQALAAVELVMKTNTADTGKYTYTYADLGDVLDECKRACDLHGLVFTQIPTVVEGFLAVRLKFFHTSGGTYEEAPLMMVLPKEAQAYGSALTYARRYQLMTVFRIAPEDDDGRAATIAAQTQPGRRTEAERLIREAIGRMDDEQRKRFVTDFKSQFRQGLSDLPVPLHGDALTWTKAWVNTVAGTIGPDADAADEQWKAEAQEAPT